MNSNVLNYTNRLKRIKQDEKQAFESDLNDIANDIAGSILARIDRVINHDKLSEDEKNENIHPTCISVRVFDIRTDNISYDDFSNFYLLDKLKNKINFKLKPSGFNVKIIYPPKDRMGNASINIQFGVIAGWTSIFKNLYWHITGQWNKIV